MSVKASLGSGHARTPVLEFKTRRGWENWLARNYGASKGVWLRLSRKTPGGPGMSHIEALHGALCYGWVDGPKKMTGHLWWLQRFVPRSPRSRWSRLHAENAERLIQASRMRPPGLKEVKAAKSDGRWRLAYDPPGSAKIPRDLLEALAGKPGAEAFFKSLSRADSYAIAYRLQAARDPKLRARRLRSILTLLAKGIRPLP